MARTRRKATGHRGAAPRLALDADDAFVAVLIAAMEASDHVSADEAARAHDLIWATRRFRHRSGEAVGRRIERVRTLFRQQGVSPLVEAAARALPARLRPAAFAIAADIVLVDGRLERAEGRFLAELARQLRLGAETARRIRDVIRIKNSA
jgi:tellurite resistance protein